MQAMGHITHIILWANIMCITYLKLVAKIVSNHGDDRNANQCDGGELPGETDHEYQGSNKSHKVPASEFESVTIILCIYSRTITEALGTVS